MNSISNHGYVPAAIMFNKTIREMRAHVEYEKFVCRMLIDNDTTRQFKQNTEDHQDSVHRFTYNNEAMEALTEKGKYEAVDKTNYKSTPSGEF